ncbi:MAG: diadenylate cyclase [Candidatus Binatota bacterium]|jgi:uncharacterized protein (TIGR00159 family)|nr:diadenylate cyclase [Candidatus Binatota bacterium]
MLEALRDIGVTQAIDIAFVASLLYFALVWIRRTKAAFVLMGIVILGATYVVARELELQLTAYLFQGFFAVFLIMIVVIFQEELRQLFERVALWSLRRRPPPALRPQSIDLLVACLTDFAKDRTGALIVVSGGDVIERHVEGGIELGARMSEPLLKSLFDPHSPGHDGAVLVDNDRITRFAAHLPLSKDFSQLARVGTRHSAALGLAERTDALCLVVSEQTGQISVARGGVLRRLANPQELGAILEGYLVERSPRRRPWRVSTDFLVRNWREKAVAAALALVLWYLFVPGSETAEAVYRVPVEIGNLPPDLAIRKIEPEAVTATFSGPRRLFYLFDPTSLSLIIDARQARTGRRPYKVEVKNLRYPKTLTLEELRPQTVYVSLTKSNEETAKPASPPAAKTAGSL